MPNSGAFRDGEVLVARPAPTIGAPAIAASAIADDYALRNVSCTVNSSDTMVDATGTFAGTKDRPLPALPTDVTYNVSVGVTDNQSDLDGFSESSEQTAYMNHGGKWSVEVKVSPNDGQVSCMYSVGTYDAIPPLIPIVPPLPTPRILT